MITLYWPDRLWTNGGIITRNAKGEPANWRKEPEGPFVDGEDFEGVGRWIANAVPANDKEEHGAFTLAKILRGRCIKNVAFVTALGLDGDKTGVTTRTIFDLLGGYERIVYTTHSSTPDAQRWRAIVKLSRRASADEHCKYIGNVHAVMLAMGINLDHQAVDPCRLWYLPSYRTRENFECYIGHGAPFDVDAALTTAAELEAERETERAKRAAERVSKVKPKTFECKTDRSCPKCSLSIAKGAAASWGSERGVVVHADCAEPVDPLARARAYVAKMDAAIEGAYGSRATFNVARKLVQDFELSDDDALTIMHQYNARCQPAWSDEDLERKVSQARNKARVSVPMGAST